MKKRLLSAAAFLGALATVAYAQEAGQVLTYKGPTLGVQWEFPTGGAVVPGAAGAFLTADGAFGFGDSVLPAVGIPAWIADPTSAKLLAALSTKTGTGLAVFGTAPTVTTLTLADATGLTQCLHVNAAGIVSGTGTNCDSGGSPGGTPNQMQWNHAGAFDGFDAGTGLLFDTTAKQLKLTSVLDDQTAAAGGNYTVLTGDASKTVLVAGGGTTTQPRAGTTGFNSGWRGCILNAGSSTTTLSTTTSLFKGAGGSTSLSLRPGDWACPSSDSTDYPTLAGINYLGMTDGLPVVGGGIGLPLTLGTRSGTGTEYTTSTGAKTNGHIASWNADGNAIDSGVAVSAIGTGSVTQVNTGTGLTGGPITGTGTILDADTAVTPGSYTFASLTVNQQGRVTAASSGSPTVVSPGGTAGAIQYRTGGGAFGGAVITGLTLGNGTSAPSAYGGTICINQFPRSLNASGGATCETVANADLANSTVSGIALGGTLAALTATDTTLTFSGSYTGATARTVGLNLGNNNAWTKAQAVTPVALTPGTTVSVDAALSNDFTLAPVQNFTLANPTNLLAGQTLNFWITQDGTGSRVLTVGTQYQAAGGSSLLVLSTAASTKDLLQCVSDTTSTMTCALVKGIAH